MIARVASRVTSAAARTSEWFASPWEKGHRIPSAILAGLGAYLVALFVSFPGTLLHRNFYHVRMWDTLKLAENWLNRDLYEQITTYRLTVPFFANVLGISSPAVLTVLFQVVPSIATLALLFYNGARRLGPRMAWPLTLALALSFLLFFTFYYGGIFDPMTHLALALVITTANPIAGFFFALAGMINDERFLIAVPFAVLWHYRGGGWTALVMATWKPAVGVCAGIAAAIALRWALTTGLIGPGIHVTQSYRLTWHEIVTEFRPYTTKGFAIGWTVFALNFFMSFRWTWLLVFLFLFRPNRLYSTSFRILLGVALVPPVLSSAIVMDVAKSIGFLFPAVYFCAVNLLQENLGTKSQTSLLWLVVLALIITPVFCINGLYPAFWLPLPIEGLRWAGISIADFDFIREWVMPAVQSDEILVPKESWQK